MKKIKVAQQNEAKIEAALAEVNGRANSFTITRFAEVADFVDVAEGKLSTLPKKDQVGAGAFCMPAGPYANSYKYGAKSTGLYLERHASGWFLVNITEEKVYPKAPEKCAIKVTKEQAEEIQRRAVADFYIMESK